MGDIHPYIYKADLVRVVDGDTYDFLLDLGFNTRKNVRVRLMGVDTAEIHNVEKGSSEYERGMEQKKFVEDALSEADSIFVRTYKDDDTDKYGRWLAEVLVDGGNSEVSNLLLEQFPELS